MTTAGKHIELWADSFHEGVWAADGVVGHLPGVHVVRSHALGFIPRYTITLPGGNCLDVDVFGGYGNWVSLPTTVKALLDWGKPDIVAYCPETDSVLFAVEETAAVPTGNQALQRCERMHGAGMAGVPFWYLLSQYGTHVDEGVRQASPWPALMALALTESFRIPSLVLFYSSQLAPEDYAVGQGQAQLFRVLAKLTANFAADQELLSDLQDELEAQYQSLVDFVLDTHENVTDFLPGEEVLADPETPHVLARIASGKEAQELSVPLLDWPEVSELPAPVQAKQRHGEFIKPDAFLEHLEAARANGQAYTLSGQAGSRPQPESRLEQWIAEQHVIHERAPSLQPGVPFALDVTEFPESQSGLRHVTTAKNILYLVDRADIVTDALEETYARLDGKFEGVSTEKALVYVSNGIAPRRIFGDPYTGQFAAFSWVFGGPPQSRRLSFAYFPHQSHGVLNPDRESLTKGERIFLSRADFLVFHSGAVYSTRDREWL